MEKVEFGKKEWLANIRKAKGLTQEDVAIRCGVSKQTISNVENGHHMPSPRLAQKIATLLDFSWYRFWEGEDK